MVKKHAGKTCQKYLVNQNDIEKKGHFIMLIIHRKSKAKVSKKKSPRFLKKTHCHFFPVHSATALQVTYLRRGYTLAYVCLVVCEIWIARGGQPARSPHSPNTSSAAPPPRSA